MLSEADYCKSAICNWKYFVISDLRTRNLGAPNQRNLRYQIMSGKVRLVTFNQRKELVLMLCIDFKKEST